MMRARTVFAALSLVLAAALALAAVAAACPPPGNGAATITASFSDGCRDFAARSSKDISYVELHYVDGRVVKHERINRRHYSIDGDELEFRGRQVRHDEKDVRLPENEHSAHGDARDRDAAALRSARSTPPSTRAASRPTRGTVWSRPPSETSRSSSSVHFRLSN